MSHYCFFDVREVTDHAKVARYMIGVFATVAQYGGRYLVLGAKSDVVEGEWSARLSGDSRVRGWRTGTAVVLIA